MCCNLLLRVWDVNRIKILRLCLRISEWIEPQMVDGAWLALMIGNSRLHWAWFADNRLKQVWHTPHLSPELISDLTQQQLSFASCLDRLTRELVALPDFLPTVPAQIPLWLASVIPAQIPLWQAYCQTQVITLAQIPLAGLYPTLGIDRALALLGTASLYSPPSLVIDAGTALTFTGADAQKNLVGGAILPGLRLQLQSLAEHTAALPYLARPDPPVLPERWTKNTADAIWSGVLYSVLAGIQDFIKEWRQQFSEGAIVLTGGDAELLLHLLHQQTPELAAQITLEPQIIFWGMQQVAQDA